MQKVCVSAVSFLNTKCFVKGLDTISDQITLSLDVPSIAAQKLVQEKVDLALVPVAIIPQLKRHFIYTNFCIGSVGEVSTVCVYSNRPFHELETIELDPNSKTSNQLLQILLNRFLKKNIQLVNESLPNENHGKLIIGDRAIQAKSAFQCEFDLSKCWNEQTGLPFIFACWVANKPLSSEFVNDFNNALANGVSRIDEVIAANKTMNTDLFNVSKYLTENISYTFDKRKRQALDYFLSMI